MNNTRRSLLKQASVGAAFAVLAPGRALAAPARFSAEDDGFYLDGKPFQVLAGEMHYPRVPRSCWRDRMKKMKALGLNTLTTYVFWNAHEPTPGRFDFSGNLDLAAYIRMAQEEGLWVNLRPGPYVCAEWDGGGFPAWLFPEPTILARSLDPRFFGPVERWLKRLAQETTPLQISRGGPIILCAVENEFGSFGSDHGYVLAMRDLIRRLGFDGVLYTADGPGEYRGAFQGAVKGINFGSSDNAARRFAEHKQLVPKGPLFCSEFWTGWFDNFGGRRNRSDDKMLLQNVDWMLSRKISISFYMFHGGTDFGFSAGANLNKSGFQPQCSSYDYDALLDEAGRPTQKFYDVQKLIQKYAPAGSASPPLPAPEAAITIPRFRLRQTAPLKSLLGQPVRSEHPQTLEALGQSHGLMLYRHKADKPLQGVLTFKSVRDYAMVSSNGRRLGVTDRRFDETFLEVDTAAGAEIEILVSTMGHVNFDSEIGKDQKGLVGPAYIDDDLLTGWDHYRLPLDDLSGLNFAARPVDEPAFYRGEFHLTALGYSFLDLRGWGHGYVWINGHNLGRYWSVGPQRSVFVPAEFLRLGANEIIILDLYADGDRSVEGGKDPLWDELAPIPAAVPGQITS